MVGDSQCLLSVCPYVCLLYVKQLDAVREICRRPSIITAAVVSGLFSGSAPVQGTRIGSTWQR